jgi:hypothetical protein
MLTTTALAMEPPRTHPGPNRRLALDGGFSSEPPRFQIRETTTGIHREPSRTMWLEDYLAMLATGQTR